jgi:ribulose-phosphate 3-epimerase
MIENPDEKIDDFICAGFGRIIVHLESVKNISAIIEKAKEFDVEIGVAIGMETDIEELDECIEKIDFVQFMGIDNIGFQGEIFNSKVLQKISTLREHYPDITISVDGGVNLKNATHIISAGANRIAVGSAIFGSEDVAGTIARFQSL